MPLRVLLVTALAIQAPAPRPRPCARLARRHVPAARAAPVALDADVARRVERFAARLSLPPADALRLLAHAALLELEGRDRRG
jgi:hypothetical protein